MYLNTLQPFWSVLVRFSTKTSIRIQSTGNNFFDKCEMLPANTGAKVISEIVGHDRFHSNLRKKVFLLRISNIIYDEIDMTAQRGSG